jgi:hypothetical protein
MTDEDPKTLVECRACRGHWKIPLPMGEPLLCPWCTEGFMDAEQHGRWREFKLSRGSKP